MDIDEVTKLIDSIKKPIKEKIRSHWINRVYKTLLFLSFFALLSCKYILLLDISYFQLTLPILGYLVYSIYLGQVTNYEIIEKLKE